VSIVAGIFVLLHGLVHLWYVTLSRGWVAFQPEMGWTGRSWLLSSSFGKGTTNFAAGVLYSLAAAGLVVSGLGLLTRADWFATALVASAIFSAVVIVLFWDGGADKLAQKGLIGVLVNLGLIAWVLLIKAN
jgi:hypothetical protein